MDMKMATQRRIKILGSVFAGLFLASTAAFADEAAVDNTYPPATWEGFDISASVIGTYQSASDSRVKDEAALRPEVFVTVPVPGIGGSFNVHVEGTTTPRTDGVTSFYGDSNANVGAATSSNGHGRLQISEFYYAFEGGPVTVNVGLLDTTAYLDTSAFAGDERTQFMNATLVHNATIDFPDYTLAMMLSTKSDGAIPGLIVVVGSSNGLGDNPSHTYPELFDMRSSGKGVFAAGELGWEIAALGDEGAARVGVWTNTADHAYLNATPGTASNTGFYGVLEGTALGTGWSLRAGMADADVSAADWFVGGAVQRQLTDTVLLGLGVTQTGVSDDLGAGTDDSTQAELYVKYDVLPQVSLSPSVQWVRNPGFDDTGVTVDEDSWIVGLRIGFEI
jgi:hypothetical protein